jgi:Holliday junction resolvasome RuvABC endonuclease subunit
VDPELDGVPYRHVKKVLAFDLGTKCGWAFSEAPGAPVHSGLIRTDPTRFESQGMRAIKFERAVKELLLAFKPTHVLFERVHAHSSVIAAQVWGSYSSLLMKVCEEAEVTYEGISVQAIKQHATGKGNATKALMVAAAKRRWPEQDIITDDVADALHLLALGLSK